MANWRCANCNREIGELETVYDFEGKAVCEKCSRFLNSSETTQENALAEIAKAVEVRRRTRGTRPSQTVVNVHYPDLPRVQTIERTSKRWKAQQAISLIVMLMGVAVFLVSAKSHPDQIDFPKVGSVIAVVFGLIWFMFVGIAIWWNHG